MPVNSIQLFKDTKQNKTLVVLPSKRSLSRKLAFDDLKLGMQHTGYIEGSVIDVFSANNLEHFLFQLDDNQSCLHVVIFSNQNFQIGLKAKILDPLYIRLYDNVEGLLIHDSALLVIRSDTATIEAEKFKALGNDQFEKHNYKEALELYSKGLECDQNHAVLFANRSATHLALGDFKGALSDALKSINLNPSNTKVYFRKGKALEGLKKLREALGAYREGLKVDPDNKNLKDEELRILKEMENARNARLKPQKWMIIPSNPERRQSSRGNQSWARLNDKAYVFWGGQCNPSDRFARRDNLGETFVCDDAVFYNPIVSGDFPRPRLYHRMVSKGNTVYLVGGADETTCAPAGYDRLYYLDTSNYHWSVKTTHGNFPKACMNSCVQIIRDKIYLFGGQISPTSPIKSRTNEMYSLDLKTMKWSAEQYANESPPVRGIASSATIFDRFMVVFGGDHNLSKCLNDTWLYDTVNKSWHDITKAAGRGPSDRGSQDFADSHGNQKLILYGGGNISGTALNDIWCLDVATLKWMEIPTLSTKMQAYFQHSQWCVNQTLYIYGGFIMRIGSMGVEMDASNKLYSYDLGKAFEDCEEEKELQRITWMCRKCGKYTQQKCKQCGEFAFCSDKCESSCADHKKECESFRGIYDEKSLLIKDLAETKSQLEKSLENASAKITQLTIDKSKMQQQSDNYKQMLEKKHEDFKRLGEEHKSLQHSLKTTKDQIDQKRAELQSIAQKSQKTNKSLSERITLLEQEKTKIEKQLEEKAKETEKLSAAISEQEKEYSQVLANSEGRIGELQQKLNNSEKERIKKLEELADTSKKLAEIEQDQECPVCMESKKDHSLVPCGHSFCKFCIEDLPKKQCPTCRKAFNSHIRVYN